MRCPECTVRNSVAAVQCKECGVKLARKGNPNAVKYALIGAGSLAVLGLGAAGLSVIPSITTNLFPALVDSESNLQKVSRRVAQGPKTKEDADHLKSELENSVKLFLEKNASLSTAEITAKMQKILPSSSYEIHVFDLPEAHKLVEVDTVLQSCNYLISGKEVAVLRKFDVFDEAKVINDKGVQTLVLLGHQNAQAGRKPQVKVLTIGSAGIKERTEQAVPFFSGEGTAKFAANGKDIAIEVTVASRAGEEDLFTPSSLRATGLPDENLQLSLVYDNGKYELKDDNGDSQMAALRAIAFVVADPAQRGRFRKYLTNPTADQLNSLGKLKVCPPLFEVKRKGKSVVAAAPAADDGSRRSRRRRREAQKAAAQQGSGNAYTIGNAEDAFEVVLARGSSGLYQTQQIRRIKVEGHTGEESATVASSYEDKTSSLVDKLLSTPDHDGTVKPEPVDTTVAVAPLAVPSTKLSEKTASSKVTERTVDAEKGTVSSALNSETVKIRRGAGTHYRTIAELPRGADLEIIGKQEGWYKVRVKGREGYIYGGFVNCKTKDAYTTATVKSGKSVKDESNRTVTHTQAGDRLVVLSGINNNRYKVQMANGRTGYVDKDALDVSVEPPTFVP
jgi:uncharacterized protein YgiM (DUF1202 family)